MISCKQAKLTDARNQYIRGDYYLSSDTENYIQKVEAETLLFVV